MHSLYAVFLLFVNKEGGQSAGFFGKKEKLFANKVDMVRKSHLC